MEQSPINIVCATNDENAVAKAVFEYSLDIESKDVDVLTKTFINSDSHKAMLSTFSPKTRCSIQDLLIFSIPSGFSGRVIFNKCHQLYLSSPSELIDLPMNGAAMLKPKASLDCVLIDCDKFKEISWWGGWSDMVRQYGVVGILHRLKSAGLLGRLPEQWCAPDNKNYNGYPVKLYNFANPITQPWSPVNHIGNQKDRESERLWFEYYLDAIDYGYVTDDIGFIPDV